MKADGGGEEVVEVGSSGGGGGGGRKPERSEQLLKFSHFKEAEGLQHVRNSKNCA